MSRRVLSVTVLIACGAGLAMAEGAFLSAREARRALFGVEMAGIYEGDGAAWRECIDPSGVTSYVIDGQNDRGRLRIDPEGRACFSYQSSDYRRENCFTIEREGQGYRFDSGEGSPDFVARTVRRGVRSCAGAEAPIS